MLKDLANVPGQFRLAAGFPGCGGCPEPSWTPFGGRGEEGRREKRGGRWEGDSQAVNDCRGLFHMHQVDLHQ
eukprot:9469392-Pyramimonas_sp.AAC.1